MPNQSACLWVGWYCMHNGGWVSTVHLLVSYIVMSPNPACLKCTLWYNYNGLTHAVIQIHVQCTSYALSCCHVSQCMSFHYTPTAVSQGSMIWGTSWKFSCYYMGIQNLQCMCIMYINCLLTQRGNTPLSIARSRGREHIVQLLEASRQR